LVISFFALVLQDISNGNTKDKPGQFLKHALVIYNILLSQNFFKEGNVGTAIEYQKLMTEIVYINLPGPAEPTPGMSGGELLHGFLAELYKAPDAETRNYVNSLCLKWNVHYRETRG